MFLPAGGISPHFPAVSLLPLALNSIPDSPCQQIAVHLTLDQIVLCPFLDSSDGNRFIIETG